MSLRFRILLSGSFALLAVMLCALYGAHVRDEAERARNEAMQRYGGEVVNLVVAKQTLEAGDVVDQANVESRDWLADLAPEGAVTSMDAAVGREVTVATPAGAPVTELTFRDVGQMAEVPSGHVAVTVPITDKLGISASVAVGSHVVAYRAAEGGSELLGADITVLSSPGADASAISQGNLTIAVAPDAVSKVLTASTAGDLRLVVPADDVEGLGESDQSAPPEVESQPSGDEGTAEGADEAAAQVVPTD